MRKHLPSPFSRRLHTDFQPNRIAARLAALRAAGAPLLDLTDTNPTRAGLRYPEKEILAALADPAVLQYRPDPLGLLPARQAVAARTGGDPARILLTASTSEAYTFLFKLLCDGGDTVLVPRPSYPLFDHLTELELVETEPYRLAWDGAWHVDLDSVRAAADASTRAVLVVSPGNPTGNFLRADELRGLAEICRERDLALICDEVFADYALRDCPGRAPSPATAEGVLTFSLSGLSKVAALPQLKLAWTHVSGPEELVAEAMQRLELIADTYLSVSSPVQHALPAIFAAAGAIQAQLRDRLLTNLAALEAARGPDAPWHVLPVEGGWSAVLRVPVARSEEEWVLALLDDGVLVHPGWFFDFPREGHLVVSLLPDAAVFREAAARLAARLRG